MKLLKRLLVLTLAICMISSLAVASYAETGNINNDSKNIIEHLLFSAVKDNSIDNGTFSVGSSIPTYVLENGAVSKFDETEYYVVYRNNEPFGIFTISGANSDAPTYSFSIDFVNKLNDAVLSKNSDFYLLVTDNQIFAVTKDQAFELMKYDVNYLTVDMPVEGTPANLASASNEATENQPYVADEYTANQVLKAVNKSTIIKYTDESQITALATIPQRRTVVEVSGDVPSYTQPSGSNYCWAASAWCVGETLNPLGKTVEECVKAAGGESGEGGSADMQKKILTDVYGIASPTLYYPLSEYHTEWLIDHDYPFIMLCFVNKDSKTLGHSVTCYAYDDSYDPISLKVMDSLVSSGASNWRWMTSPESGTDYKITNGKNTYTYTFALSPEKL